MRKIVAFITLLTLAGLLGLSAPTQLLAQGTCMPDCFGTPFGLNQTITLQLPSGCWVKIVYAKRFACYTYYDVNIVSVTPLTPGCDSLSVQQLVAQSTNVLLVANPMNFPPTITDTAQTRDTCVTNWRVTRGACWKRKAINNCQDSALATCDTSVCCLQSFTVCIYNGHRRVRQNSGGSTGGCDSGTTGCSNVCGYVDSTGGGVAPPIPSSEINDLIDHEGTPSTFASFANGRDAFVTSVIHDPANGRIHFSLHVSRRTRVALELLGAMGKTIGTVANREFEPGVYDLNYDPSSLQAPATSYQVATPGSTLRGSLVSQR